MRARIERSTAPGCTTALRSAVLAFVLVAGGCDACDDRPPIPVASRNDENLLERAPEPKRGELETLWKAATDGVDVRPGEKFALRYRIPTCSARYELRSLVLSEVADGRDPAGVEAVAELVANPDTANLTWQVVGLRTFLIHDGEREERPNKRSEWPTALVSTDGTRWNENAGPSTLWAAYTVIPPLSTLFPWLPPEGAAGVYPWKVSLFHKRTIEKLQKRVMADAAVPNVSPRTYEAKAHVSQWQRLHGSGRETPVAVVTAEWTEQRHELDPMESARAERWVGRYTVADNGMLVHAVAISGRFQWWEVAPGERNEKLGSAEIELRLVQHCKSATLPPFAAE